MNLKLWKPKPKILIVDEVVRIQQATSVSELVDLLQTRAIELEKLAPGIIGTYAGAVAFRMLQIEIEALTERVNNFEIELRSVKRKE